MADDFDPSLLSGYLDDELTAAETDLVKRVLAENTELQRELEEMRQLRAAIAALPMPPVDADIVAAVRQRVERQRVRQTMRHDHAAVSPLKMVLSLAVAACVLVAVGWAVLQRQSPSPSVAMERPDDRNGRARQQRGAPGADGLPLADGEAAVASAEAGASVPKERERLHENLAYPDVVQSTEAQPAEAQPAQPAEAQPVAEMDPAGAAAASYGMQLEQHSASRMMRKGDPRGVSPQAFAVDDPAASPADSAAEPLAADFAPRSLRQAPMMAPAMRSMASPPGANALAADGGPAGADSRADAAAGLGAGAGASRNASDIGRPQARFVDRRQLSLGKTVRVPEESASDAEPVSGTAQLVISTVRRDQLEQTIDWLRERVPFPSSPGTELPLNPATQVIAIQGDAAAVDRLGVQWRQYMQQIDAPTRWHSLLPKSADRALQADAGAPASDAAAVTNGAALSSPSPTPVSAGGMLAIEFQIAD